MAESRRVRAFTLEQKAALVSEIARRYCDGEGSLQAIAQKLGTSDASYHNWVKAGIRPAGRVARVFSAAERERLIAEVGRLQADGQGLSSACREVGISDESYRRWREDAHSINGMRPVEITAVVPAAPSALASYRPSTTEALTLMAPSGYRIEGLGGR